MRKLMFFDCRELDRLAGFERCLEKPVKRRGGPLLVPDQPWENGNMQLYGSVIKAPDRPFQLWYSVVHKPWRALLAYAESDDGIRWRKPLLDLVPFKGRKTNLLLDCDIHGPAILYDAQEPREAFRYKMMAGAAPSGCILAWGSPDGIHWKPMRPNPVIGTNPDSPMGFLRTGDGRYVAYHRFSFGRRVCRSESWNGVDWTNDPRLVLEPDAGDPPQIQFYGMGSALYGPYEIGTLWIFHTDPTEFGMGHMNGYQEAELTYARSGYAWHRAMQGTAFIPRGGKGAWDCGNLQCASQPVFLDREIRYYYAAGNQLHEREWELRPQHDGLGMATLQPDRFIGLQTNSPRAEFLTLAFRLNGPALFLNAKTEKNGWIRMELLDAQANPLPGFSANRCRPISGDALDHPIVWERSPALPVDSVVRLRLTAHQARVYSLSIPEPNETPVYHRFYPIR